MNGNPDSATGLESIDAGATESLSARARILSLAREFIAAAKEVPDNDLHQATRRIEDWTFGETARLEAEEGQRRR